MLDVSAGKDVLESLKKTLLDMPKPGSEKSGGRSSAILPGVAYSSQRQEAAPEPDEDDDD